MHDDARTNIAIALTAAEKGAAVANYCEVTSLLKDAGGRAQGVAVLDRVTNERFDVRAKAVVFCGGPYTDSLRKLGDEKAEDAVAGASGTHVVLPGYYCSRLCGSNSTTPRHRRDDVRAQVRGTRACWITTPPTAAFCFSYLGSDIRSSEPLTLRRPPRRDQQPRRTRSSGY